MFFFSVVAALPNTKETALPVHNDIMISILWGKYQSKPAEDGVVVLDAVLRGEVLAGDPELLPCCD